MFGLLLCTMSVISFSAHDLYGLNTKGIYRFSRNPMYIAYFICFMGIAFLTQWVLLLGIVIIFQISSHWLVLAEERWCVETFGVAYQSYMEQVRRYL